MKLSQFSTLTNSQEEFQVTEDSQGRQVMWIGTELQDAWELTGKSTIWIGKAGRTVSLSPTETNSTPVSMKLHRPASHNKQLRSYAKNDTPYIGSMRRVSNKINYDALTNIASFRT